MRALFIGGTGTISTAIVAEKIKDLTFDVVCEFIGFHVEDVERDSRLQSFVQATPMTSGIFLSAFTGKTVFGR